MKNINSYDYDIAVIGGGHAGIEAALAGARLGSKVILFTMSLDSVGNMPCNPSIGGTGKGHLVFEIDALGGEMGKAADEVMLQCRMLNLSKGPAVRSLRFQADRKKYQTLMKQILENTPNLDIYQAEITEILFEFDCSENKKYAKGVKTRTDGIYKTKTVIIAGGTYLNSNIIIGKTSVENGPDSLSRSSFLAENLRQNGINMMRFKTGTPARVHADTIDYSQLEIQGGDEKITHFSSDTSPDRHLNFAQKYCYIAYTNEETHRIIRENLHRSPMYSGKIHGTGARYCPSIEDKVVRFTDKERHPIFVEPMGEDTKEMYLQGFSTSMPIDVQEKIVRSIKGFENIKIMRSAYAIEYDCCDPLQLKHTLEFRDIENLFGAGQFNGTSGYEEAAAQGLIAGINAALKSQKKALFTLNRTTSYIGMLIDDLVTKGTNEPYRVMTSRTEYRLILRQDNAGERLMRYGCELGLVSKERYEKLLLELEQIDREIARTVKQTVYATNEVNDVLKANNSTEISVNVKLIDLLRRPELNYENLKEIDINRPDLPENIFDRAMIKIQYDGYIKKQQFEINRHKKLEGRKLGDDIDYSTFKGLRIEAIQKLIKHKPESIGEAAQISGISPADITALIINLDRKQ